MDEAKIVIEINEDQTQVFSSLQAIIEEKVCEVLQRHGFLGTLPQELCLNHDVKVEMERPKDPEKSIPVYVLRGPEMEVLQARQYIQSRYRQCLGGGKKESPVTCTKTAMKEGIKTDQRGAVGKGAVNIGKEHSVGQFYTKRSPKISTAAVWTGNKETVVEIPSDDRGKSSKKVDKDSTPEKASTTYNPKPHQIAAKQAVSLFDPLLKVSDVEEDGPGDVSQWDIDAASDCLSPQSKLKSRSLESVEDKVRNPPVRPDEKKVKVPKKGHETERSPRKKMTWPIISESKPRVQEVHFGFGIPRHTQPEAEDCDSFFPAGKKYKGGMKKEDRSRQSSTANKEPYPTYSQNPPKFGSRNSASYASAFTNIPSRSQDRPEGVSKCDVDADHSDGLSSQSKVRSRSLESLEEKQKVMKKKGKMEMSPKKETTIPLKTAKSTEPYLRAFTLDYHKATKNPPTVDGGASSKCDGLITPPEGALILNSDPKVLVYKGDIVSCAADAIVNPCSTQAGGGGSLADAISRRAGKGYKEECQRKKSLQPTDVQETSSGDLPCGKVFHVHSPSWGDDENHAKNERILRDTLQNCIEKAEEAGMKTLAIPAVSGGKAHGPSQKIAGVFHTVFQRFLQSKRKTSLKEVHIVDSNQNVVNKIEEVFKEMANTQDIKWENYMCISPSRPKVSYAAYSPGSAKTKGNYPLGRRYRASDEDDDGRFNPFIVTPPEVRRRLPEEKNLFYSPDMMKRYMSSNDDTADQSSPKGKKSATIDLGRKCKKDEEGKLKRRNAPGSKRPVLFARSSDSSD